MSESINYKYVGDVDILSGILDSDTVLVERGGYFKRVPAGLVGDTPEKTQELKDLIDRSVQDAVDVAIGFVTPDDYGAFGDGVHDDAPALKAALESGLPVKLTRNLWLFSSILVENRSIELDGQGFTLYCRSAGITIRSVLRDSPAGDCALVSNNVQSDYEAERSPYFQGHLVYKGRKTLPESYADSTVKYFDIYSAWVHDLHMQCEKMYGDGEKTITCLALYHMCDSVIERCSTVLTDDEDGAGGIFALYCQNTRISHCYSSGWTILDHSGTDGRGYGFQIMGDNVILEHSAAEQCKHCIAVGSVHNCWSTNIIIDHCNFRCDFTKQIFPETGAGRYRQLIDVHGDAHNVLVTGCNLYWWALDGNTQSAPVIIFRNPTTILSNCNIYGNGGNIAFGEFAKIMYFDQLYAPAVHISTGFRQGGDTDPTHYMDELHISNSDFARLRDCNSPTKIYMTGCTVRQYVINVQYLIARNCLFARETSWAAQPTMVLLGDCILSDCVIYGHRENSISPRTPIIRAPKNSVRMSNCKIYKRTGNYLTFDTDQVEGSGNWYEDVFAFYLNTQCELDKNILQ